MRVAVVGVPDARGSSRDPGTVAAGLRRRGRESVHLEVQPALPIPTVRAVGDQAGRGGPLDAVLALGVEAALAGADQACRAGAPLLLALRPGDLPPLVAHDATALLLRHLPLAAVVVESTRGRNVAAAVGADPARTFVIAPGVPVATDVPTREALRPRPIILADVSAVGASEASSVERMLDRVEAAVGAPIHRATSVDDSLWRGPWTLVVIPGTEGDPTLPLLRAMSHGLPVLASDAALGAEVLASMRHGLLAAADDVDEWVEKVRYVVADTALQAHLGRGARAHVAASGDVERSLDALDDYLGRVVGAWNAEPLHVSTPPADRAM